MILTTSPNLRRSQEPLNPGKRISGMVLPFFGNIFVRQAFSAFDFLNLLLLQCNYPVLRGEDGGDFLLFGEWGFGKGSKFISLLVTFILSLLAP